MSPTTPTKTTPPNPDPYETLVTSMNSSEDRNTIPIFKGSEDDTIVTDWLVTAERVELNNKWTDTQKIASSQIGLKTMQSIGMTI